jgi:hypothetical protein
MGAAHPTRGQIKRMEGVNMTRRSQGLPDEVLKKFTVSVPKLRTRTPVTADNQHNPDGLLAAANMMVDVSYVG